MGPVCPDKGWIQLVLNHSDHVTGITSWRRGVWSCWIWSVHLNVKVELLRLSAEHNFPHSQDEILGRHFALGPCQPGLA